jgi:hypothetical protein
MRTRRLPAAVALGCAIAAFSAPAAHAVPPSPAPTSTTVTLSPSGPLTVGDTVTLSITVAPAPNGGIVTVSSNGDAIAGCGSLTLTAGQASCATTISGDAGYRTYSAAYSGNADYAGSTGWGWTEVRGKSTTTVTATPKQAAPGQAMKYAAKVTPRPTAVSYASINACYASYSCEPEPTPEYVQFSVDGKVIDACKKVLVNETTGEANCAAAAPAADGQHAVVASYLGHTWLATSAGTDTFTVKGPDAPVPGAAVSSGSLRFGTTVIGSSSTLTVDVASTGSAALNVGAAAAEAPFAVTANACSGTPVAPGASCTVAVAFTPTAADQVPGRLTIETDAGPQVVQLSGTGVQGAAFAPKAKTTLTTTSPSPNNSSVSIPLACPNGVACTLDGTVVITTADFSRAARASAAKSRTVARFKGVRVAAGKVKKIKLKLSPKFVRDAQKDGVRLIRATLTVNTTFSGDTRATTRQRLRIRIPRPLQARRPAQAPRFTG